MKQRYNETVYPISHTPPFYSSINNTFESLENPFRHIKLGMGEGLNLQ